MKKVVFLFLMASTVCVFGQEKKIKKAIDYINNNNFDEGINLITDFKNQNPTSPLWAFAMYKVYSNTNYPKYELEAAFNYLQYVNSWGKNNSLDKDWCKSFNLCLEKLPFQIDSLALLALSKIEEDRTEIKYNLFLQNFKDTPANKKGLDSYHNWKYEQALEKQSKEAIEEFIKKYPNAVQVQNAKQKIEEIEYNLCIQANDISKMQGFIKKYPNSIKSKDLSNKIVEIDYKACEDKNDVVCLENFLKKYPDSHYSLLLPKKIEEISFNNSKKQGTKESYENFLKKYPSSIFSTEVKKKLDELVNGVVITAQGQGLTSEEAKKNALRNAIEQAFGTFISSKTEIFNDEIVADQMSSVSSGNIKSYEVLNESQLPSGTWASTLRVIVSVDKLTSFVEAKGIAVEIKGGLFALNIKQQLLNEESERNIIRNLIGTVHNLLQQSYDYSLEVKDPQSIDGSSENWEVPMIISVKPNQNMDFIKNYFLSTLSSIGLSKSELENYNRLKKPVFEIDFKDGDSLKKFYLRTESSFFNFRIFENLWFYTHSFYVTNGLKTIREIGEAKEAVEGRMGLYYTNSSVPIISFPTYSTSSYPQMEIRFISSKENKNQVVYIYNDKISLDEISKITKYEIKQDSIRNEYINGGFRIKSDKKLKKIDIIMAPEAITFESPKNEYGDYYNQYMPNYLKVKMDSLIKKINANNYLGYNNWRIISKQETEAFLTNFISNTFDNNILTGLEHYSDSRVILTSSEEIRQEDVGPGQWEERIYLKEIYFYQYDRDDRNHEFYGLHVNKPDEDDFKRAHNTGVKTIILVRDFK